MGKEVKSVNIQIAEPKKKVKINKESFLDIDYLELPADLELAKLHAQSHRIHQINFDPNSNQKLQTCECCSMPIEDSQNIQQLHHCFSDFEVPKIFSSIPIYLTLIKYVLISLLTAIFMLIIIQIFISVNNFQEMNNYCNAINGTIFNSCMFYQKFNDSWLYSMSYENIEFKYNISAKIYSSVNAPINPDIAAISFWTLFVLALINFGFVTIANKVIQKTYEGVTSPSKFTIMIEGIAMDNDDENKILECIGNSNSPAVVNLSYKVDSYCSAKHEFLKLQNKILFCNLKKKNFYETSMCCLCCEECDNYMCFNWSICENKNKLEQLVSYQEHYKGVLENLYSNIKNKNFVKENFSGVVFATFPSEKNAIIYSNNFSKFFFQSFFKNILSFFSGLILFITGKKSVGSKKKFFISGKRACEPEDIIWQNLEYWDTRIFRTFLVYCASSIFLILSLSTMIGFNYAQGALFPTNKWGVNYFLSFIFAILAEFINFLIYELMIIFIEFEKQPDLDEYQSSLCFKVTFLTFISNSISPILANLATGNYYNNKQILYGNLLMIFLFNSIYYPLYLKFQLGFLSKIASRNILESKWYYGANLKLNQKSVNEIFENPKMEYIKKLSYIGKTILMSFFYIPLFPIGTIISFIGLFFFYIVERINIYSIYKPPEVISPNLAKNFIAYFKISFFIFAVMIFVYYKFMFFGWANTCLIFYGLLLFIPYHDIAGIFTCCRCLLRGTSDLDFNSIYADFNLDYERVNPVTCHQGWVKYFNELLNFGEISDYECKMIMKNLNDNQENYFDEYFRTNSSLKRFLRNHELRYIAKSINQEFADINKFQNYGEDFLNKELLRNYVCGNIYTAKKNSDNVRLRIRRNHPNHNEKEDDNVGFDEKEMSSYDKDFELPNENIIDINTDRIAIVQQFEKDENERID